MSQDATTSSPQLNHANNAPHHDPAATPAPPGTREPTAAFERVDVHALAVDVAQSMDPTGTRLVVHGPHAVVPTHPGMLRPCLRLLVEDGLRAAGPHDRVEVVVRVEGFDVDLVVRDPGTVSPAESGAGAGLTEAGPLARRLGARLQLSLDPAGRTEVRLRLPRLEAERTILVVGSSAEPAPQAIARLGMCTLHVRSVEEALQAHVDGRTVRAVLLLPTAWEGARPQDVLALRCAVLPAPMVSAGPVPDEVEALIEARIGEGISHHDLREALLSDRRTDARTA